jgi:hypothetical protein
MRRDGSWAAEPRSWIEIFALANLAGLAPDIFLAHSVNRFHAAAEYVPFVFSLVSPLFLLPALWALATGRERLWRSLGHAIAWTAIVVGITGLVFHLESQFFQRRTIASLVYTAPFAAPLAHTGLGLLLVMNRTVDSGSRDWGRWIVLLSLGGFAGNFVFSLTDHAQNGFFHPAEWVPVISSAIAIGFLAVPLVRAVSGAYLRSCAGLMAAQAVVGVAGFILHVHADVLATGTTLFDRVVFGAPVFAPLLFPDLALLAVIGLRELWRHPAATEPPLAAPVAAGEA